METSIATSHLVFSAGALLIAYIFASAVVIPLLSSRGKYLNSQAWIGLKKQWFARYRGGFATLKYTREMIVEGYDKFSRHGMTYILPQFSSDPVVILPPERLNELLNLPDNKVDPHLPNSESIATKYTVGEDVSFGPHIDIVRRQLTRKLHTLTTDVYEELVFSTKQNWPANKTEWTKVKTHPTCMKIVSRAANRVFAGKTLCRNEDFLEHCRLYAVSVFKTGGIMRTVPKFLQPIAGPILTREMRKHFKICSDIAVPEIRRRLAHLQGSTKVPGCEVPNDALQWLLVDCIELAKSNPQELDENLIVRRLLLLNMVAIHTTSMVTTNTILDLYSSPDKEEYLAGLREECVRVLSQHGGVWTKEAVNSLLRVDSAIRESMRYSNLADIGMKRQVIDPNGVTLGDGTHFPHGVRLAAPNYSIHLDPKYYPDRPDTWDAFRFSRPREDYLSKVQAGANANHLQKVLEQKNQALIATGSEWLAFGHGRHACPGRFFASQEMKLLLAHVVMNYDIKIEGGRPENLRINGAVVPTNDAEMFLKLR
ncbi:Cytochrome P450 monooxygenase [Pseudocercospora fuligena]|uniref:Cytochrome P450 monooxygenase n=1 Tax=Pseudocercospora fuligena TaxID=685502 RepID=A0A8H6RIB7_9PEZI|nr:Cytochrome P450 monooxygenase [Pseudocercospora fuligena]